MSWLPHLPLGAGAEAVVDWIKAHLPGLLSWIANVFNDSSGGLTDFFLLFHPLLVAVIFALLAAWCVRSGSPCSWESDSC